jgi:hypothetical protein
MELRKHKFFERDTKLVETKLSANWEHLEGTEMTHWTQVPKPHRVGITKCWKGREHSPRTCCGFFGLTKKDHVEQARGLTEESIANLIYRIDDIILPAPLFNVLYSKNEMMP